MSDSSTLNPLANNFALILYPESLEHINMLQYLETHPYVCEYVGILHDKDILEDGTPKKPHYHIVLHYKRTQRLSTILKFFSVWIDYMEPVTNFESYLFYMLHETPDSLDKHQYSPSEMIGSSKLINKYLQSSNFVQLGELCNFVSHSDGSMIQLLSFVVNSGRSDLLDCVKQYQSLICTMSNQEFSRRPKDI